MTKRKAFTLVEMLVVVGILTLLASILFPAFAAVRVAAKRTKCLSNMRQLAIGIRDYCQQNDGFFPSTSSGYQPWNAIDPNARLSDGSLKYKLNGVLFSKGLDVLQCPADLGDDVNDGISKFKETGESYWFVDSTSLQGLGICAVMSDYGTWFEEDVGPNPGPTWDWFLSKMYGASNVDLLAEYHSVRGKVTSDYANKSEFYVPDLATKYSEHLKWKLRSHTTNPGIPTWTIPGSYYYYDNNTYIGLQANEALDVANGHVHVFDDTSGLWPHPVKTIDYWKYQSKKVCAVDRDGLLLSSGAINSNTGFWHGYPRMTDPNNSAKEWVRIHAAFLDGHAEGILLGKYSDVHNEHEYY
ncbi:MAG: hypothetical protein BIFFINMI_02547 [Phycisphaerae bacterium]|nr:hypothetical protein [Phycisphaerae bacterium]